jgi:lactate dehydrogenase-like 2-hydroxyacid dehydrogenase
VDYEYAKEKGIPVLNVPVYGTDNVSQFAVSLLLEVCSHIGHHNDSVHAGEWASNIDWCYWHFPMIEVSGKTAGIIGLGKIGVNTAKNCIITPHISWATKEARERIMQTTADNIKAFMDGAPVNVVNK